jgi:hypothetical protein
VSREYLVELDPRQTDGTPVTLRFSRWGFVSLRGDTPSDTAYEPRVIDPGNLSLYLWDDSTTGGASRVSWGEVTLNNIDGALDYLLEDDYGFAGCAIRILTGTLGTSLSTFVTLFTGTMEQAEYSDSEVRILVRDRQYELMNLPLSTAQYAGTNELPAGLEGTPSDIKGQVKPLVFGRVQNITAPCVNTSRLIYQVSDTEILSVDMVYDKGLELVDGGTAPPEDIDPGGDGDVMRFGFNAGDVSTSNDTLELAPASPDDAFGDIVDGDACLLKKLYSNSVLPAPLAISTTYYLKVVDVPTRKVSLYPTSGDAIAGTNKINITDRGSYAYNGLDVQPAVASPPDAGVPSGEYVVTPEAGGSYFRLGQSPAGLITADVTQGATVADRTVAQVLSAIAVHRGIDELDIDATDVSDLDTACAYEVGVFVADDRSALEVMDEVARSIGAYYYFSPTGILRMGQLTDPTAETPDLTIIEPISVERIRTNDPGRGVPAYRVTVRYSRNWTVQNNDLAGAVTDARRAFLVNEYREAVAEDRSVQDWNPASPELTFDTLLLTEADAQAEATRLLGLYSARRDTFRVTVKMSDDLAALQLGNFVGLQFYRYGLSAGKTLVLTGIETDWQADKMQLTLWG